VKRRLVLLALGTLLMGSTTSCDLEFDFVADAIGQQQMKHSRNPEVLAIRQIRANAYRMDKARLARNKFIATGDQSALDEALKADPHDPELLALDYARALVAEHDSDEAERLFIKVVLDRRVRGLNDDVEATKQEVSRLALDAFARMMAKRLSGGILAPSPGDPNRPLYDRYCAQLRHHNRTYASDGWTVAHQLDFGVPCTS
jgi:hypothetical protein